MINTRNNDLVTLYNTVCNFELPFYARKTDWVNAYIKVDKFINSIPVGTYYNHPIYKNRVDDMILDSRNTDWVIFDFKELDL